VEKLVISQNFWKGKRVLVTGHTGFKGAWLSLMLSNLGAEVTGMSLDNYDTLGIYKQGNISGLLGREYFEDINKMKLLQKIISTERPEIVFHLAAQSLVTESYLNPYKTFETNFLGTLNVLESVKNLGTIATVVVVTSDKCYENQELGRPFLETDAMGGIDPYSASKGAAEILSRSLGRAWMPNSGIRISTARAGNVFGGGDWSNERIVPDVFRSLFSGVPLSLRSPGAIRPWQHVFEPLIGYLILAEKSFSGGLTQFEGFNFAPGVDNQITVNSLVELFASELATLKVHESSSGGSGFFESHTLRLDNSKARKILGWTPVLTLQESVHLTLRWYEGLIDENVSLEEFSRKQVSLFLENYVN
jgi:CDP-glucose 4,6-dehydratase